MVDNVIVIIQARMNSERLPGKVLLPINEIPLIGFIINRLKQIQYPIIVATSTNKENDPLVEYVSKFGVRVFRGSENDVLERFYFAAKEMHAEIIVRLTADNPFLESVFLMEQVKFFLKFKDSRTYLSTSLSSTFPLGISLEIFSFNLLTEAYINATLPGEREHVTPYMYNNKNGNIQVISQKYIANKNHYRLTVDTESDYIFIKKLVAEYDCAEKSIDEIINILDNNQHLLQINSHNTQKKWND